MINGGEGIREVGRSTKTRGFPDFGHTTGVVRARPNRVMQVRARRFRNYYTPTVRKSSPPRAPTEPDGIPITNFRIPHPRLIRNSGLKIYSDPRFAPDQVATAFD